MRSMHRHRVLALAALLVLAGLSGCSAAVAPTAMGLLPAATLPAPEQLRAHQATVVPTAGPNALSVPEIARRISPAVVQVTNVQEVQVQQFSQPVPETAGIGSGVIYDPGGLILTNDHVVSGASQVLVSLPDGRSFSADIVGTDPQTDLAVLKISGPNLPVAPLGDSSTLVVGDSVVAIGNALALAGGPTVTQGIVSALGRAIQAPSPSNAQPGTPEPAPSGGTFLFNLIQTDAPINPGNSGGPLVNMQAQVIGINTLVAVSTSQGAPVEGIGFAQSINQAKAIAAQLVTTGQAIHPYLGIQYVPLNPALAAHLNLSVTRGMYVTAVTSGSPAAQAGIQPGDVIISADGQDLNTESSLASIVNQHKPGDTITLTILRNGQRQTVSVTLAQMPAP